MSLPPFDDLEIYAAGVEDLPQRFYVDPESEMITDWKLTVDGQVLPVHSQVVAIASKLFWGCIKMLSVPKTQ
jgi:hypothetical protein